MEDLLRDRVRRSTARASNGAERVMDGNRFMRHHKSATAHLREEAASLCEEETEAMTRPKTISDQELLAVARKVFRAEGRTASTRAIARQAGISEGVLYQRFGSKEELFFASMAPGEPDIDALLGPEPPNEEASAFLRNVTVRMATYFSEVIPLAIQIITHPSAHRAGMERARSGLAQVRKGLVARLEWFEARRLVRPSIAQHTAQLLMSLAHDWALGHAGLHPASRHKTEDLEEMAEIVWKGINRKAPRPRRCASDGEAV
jgi:AcrR family transcriptional regulator